VTALVSPLLASTPMVHQLRSKLNTAVLAHTASRKHLSLEGRHTLEDSSICLPAVRATHQQCARPQKACQSHPISTPVGTPVNKITIRYGQLPGTLACFLSTCLVSAPETSLVTYTVSRKLRHQGAFKYPNPNPMNQTPCPTLNTLASRVSHGTRTAGSTNFTACIGNSMQQNTRLPTK
jgi:hypothetical protein